MQQIHMLHGTASVEIVDRLENIVANDNVVERCAFGYQKLVWVRINVRSFVRARGGYRYVTFDGFDGWVHEDNFRNFVSLNSAAA